MGVATASDIAAWHLERGRGYAAGPVEEMRAAAADALAAAEARIADISDALALVQAEAAGQGVALDLPSVVARLNPAQLRQAGVVAVGRAIVDAEELADQITARSRAEASRLSTELARMAAALLEALDAGRNPTYDAARLRMAASRVLQAATAPPAPPRPDPSRPG